MGMKAGGFGSKVKNYVFSRHPQGSLLQGFELVREPIKPFVQRLRAQPRKDIWMMGGGEIIHVIPILIGEGIPLIKPQHRSVPLKLLSAKKFPDGVVRLNYRVLKHRGNRTSH
jgi:dihydrofolate reductase